jgi:PAS domain S-box-containing protein
MLPRRQIGQDAVGDAAILAAEHELSPHGILVVDQQGRWASFNKRFIDLWEIPEEIVRSRSNTDGVNFVLSKIAQPQKFLARLKYLYEHMEERSHDEIAMKDGRTFERDSAPLALASGQTNGRIWFFRDVTERIQGAAAKSQLAAIVESSHDAIVCADSNGIVISWNAGAERLYGYTASEMIGQSIAVVVPADRQGEGKEAMARLLAAGEAIDYEAVRIRKDGTPVDVSFVLSPIKAGDGSVVAVSAIMRDITARKRSEQELRNTTRALDTLSRANEAVFRATTEDSLYRQMCQVVVDFGGYALAWIGLAEDDPGKTVRPVAYAGRGSDYLERADITWADAERGRGLTGTAIRDGVVQMNHNSADDPRMAPWREEVLKRGLVSSIAFPLQDDSRVFGALSIYSRHLDAFGTEEVALLSRLASNLSYGVVALRARADRELAARNLEQAKEKAERAEALLQDAIDTIGEAFLICDAEDRHVLCNESYRRIYEYESGEQWVAGRTREDGLRRSLANSRFAEPAGRDPAWVEEWVRKSLEVPSWAERPLADGRCLLVTRQRMRSGGIAVLMVDITPLKQAQSALRDSEVRLERAQEIAQIGNWELDVATGDIVWSRQLHRMFGLPLDFKPTRESIGPGVHAADLQPRLDWIADLAAGRQRDPMEMRIRRPDGEERLILTEGRPEVDADGVIRRIVGTAQDITERRQTERALAQSQKMDALGQLTGGMAHDFNNMLGIIIGNLDLLKPLVGANAMADELCAEARDGAVRCADLIRRLLAFARRQSLRAERTDVNALVSDVSRMLGRTLGERITLTLDLDAALWPVQVDAAQLEAALINMATNARDAMPKGGQLAITSRNTTLDAGYAAHHPDASAGDYALIEVSDTGTGIPPEIVNRIFDPFFTTKGAGQGTGLGLSMAFGFVKQSGGHLSVYSEPGLGTTFRLYLPRSDGGEAAPASAPGSDAVVGGAETVLVVEDNAQLRRTAERQLTELGYTVREADGAEPALTLLSGTDAVDLLFTDIVMPGAMDGLDLAYQAARLRPGLRVLLTSGFPGGRAADQRVADSPYRLLDKPYSLKELAQAVRTALDSGGGRGNMIHPAAGRG